MRLADAPTMALPRTGGKRLKGAAAKQSFHLSQPSDLRGQLSPGVVRQSGDVSCIEASWYVTADGSRLAAFSPSDETGVTVRLAPRVKFLTES